MERPRCDLGSSNPPGTAAQEGRQAKAELIGRVLDGNGELFHELLKPSERTMFLVALAILGNRADAEDAVQGAVLKAWQMLAQFRHEASFRTWLIQIVINQARAALRRNRRYSLRTESYLAKADASYDVAQHVPDSRELPLQSVLRKEAAEELRQALGCLSPAVRRVAILRDLEEFDTRETATMLSITEGAVKTRLSRAHSQLRNTLRRA